jgi:hypothetical protein
MLQRCSSPSLCVYNAAIGPTRLEKLVFTCKFDIQDNRNGAIVTLKAALSPPYKPHRLPFLLFI